MTSIARLDAGCTEPIDVGARARLAPVLPPLPAMIPIPSRLLAMNAALRLYGELYRRGADSHWVSVSIRELADETGYSWWTVNDTLTSLANRDHIRMKRAVPRGRRAVRLVAHSGAAS
jgi:hypothetical protein